MTYNTDQTQEDAGDRSCRFHRISSNGSPVERGEAVGGIDNCSDYYDVQLKEARARRILGFPGFRLLRADIAHRASVVERFAAECLRKVVHLAAQAGVGYSIVNPCAYVEANIVGLVNNLDGCPRGPRPSAEKSGAAVNPVFGECAATHRRVVWTIEV